MLDDRHLLLCLIQRAVQYCTRTCQVLRVLYDGCDLEWAAVFGTWVFLIASNGVARTMCTEDDSGKWFFFTGRMTVASGSFSLGQRGRECAMVLLSVDEHMMLFSSD